MQICLSFDKNRQNNFGIGSFFADSLTQAFMRIDKLSAVINFRSEFDSSDASAKSAALRRKINTVGISAKNKVTAPQINTEGATVRLTSNAQRKNTTHKFFRDLIRHSLF